MELRIMGCQPLANWDDPPSTGDVRDVRKEITWYKLINEIHTTYTTFLKQLRKIETPFPGKRTPKSVGEWEDHESQCGQNDDDDNDDEEEQDDDDDDDDDDDNEDEEEDANAEDKVEDEKVKDDDDKEEDDDVEDDGKEEIW